MTESGELIGGRYRLTARLGSGAMGVVWRARDERLGRTVAVKQLVAGSVSHEAEAEAVQRAMREARITARLHHPHAIAVHDVTEHEGRPCLVMEYLPARSLSEAVESEGVVSPDQAARIGGQVAAALAAAHEIGIVHRDVKPDNVLLTDDGTAKIADFGISRAMDDPTVTAVGILVGTPAYMAPEVAKGRPCDFASDVFSLGSTLYASLEGKPPFGMSDNAIALLHVVAAGEVPAPKRSGDLTELLLSMLDPEPARRPTMREVAEQLAPDLPTSNLVADTQLMPVAPRKYLRRGLAVAAAAGLLVAVGVAVAAVSRHPAVVSAPPVNSPAPTTSSPVTTTEVVAESAECEARYTLTDTWSTGYQVAVTVINRGSENMAGWVVTWTLPNGQRISNLWNGTLTQRGSTVMVRNASWNAVLAAHGSTSFGLVGAAPAVAQLRPVVRCMSP